MIKFKKNLVISAVGDESLHRCWSESNQFYDTMLIYYGDGEGYADECSLQKRQKG